jgi:hypothetical protein
VRSLEGTLKISQNATKALFSINTAGKLSENIPRARIKPVTFVFTGQLHTAIPIWYHGVSPVQEVFLKLRRFLTNVKRSSF